MKTTLALLAAAALITGCDRAPKRPAQYSAVTNYNEMTIIVAVDHPDGVLSLVRKQGAQQAPKYHAMLVLTNTPWNVAKGDQVNAQWHTRNGSTVDQWPVWHVSSGSNTQVIIMQLGECPDFRPGEIELQTQTQRVRLAAAVSSDLDYWSRQCRAADAKQSGF